MALNDWNWRHPVELQDVPWDCAAASTSWALNAAGIAISEREVVAGLGPDRISPAYGLLDASGAGLVSYLAEVGVTAENDPSATWSEVVQAAGFQPMIMGGRGWCHWTGVRLSTVYFPTVGETVIALANPAPGYEEVDQVLYELDFERLGEFSAVWFTKW
jgi:hypothetical protein